jgi:hypothetical protein
MRRATPTPTAASGVDGSAARKGRTAFCRVVVVVFPVGVLSFYRFCVLICCVVVLGFFIVVGSLFSVSSIEEKRMLCWIQNARRHGLLMCDEASDDFFSSSDFDTARASTLPASNRCEVLFEIPILGDGRLYLQY